ncbi:MFS transporter [Actinopolymorpha alba]|uniref:MFS transporter n=1 Tax=Actinopolymorpha alba TaxID=533267 RepID=UPI00035C106C|nr:MFS transporter [Actinopolymorpha alba]
MLFVAFDFFVLLLALPHLAADLGTTASEQLWIVDIYGFMVGGLLLTMGSVGDRIGRRRLLVLGAAGFGAASILAALSTSPEMLLIARALLGVAGATLGPTTLGLISVMFRNEAQRAQAIGIWAAAFTVGAIVGPFIGGLMLTSFWWGSVFLLAVPVSVVIIATARALLPESDIGGGRIDVVSAALSLMAILVIVFGVKQAATEGWHPVIALAFLVGFVLGGLFIRRQKRLAEPMLDLSLFADRALSLPLVALLCYTAVGAAGLYYLTTYLQTVAGLSPPLASLALLPCLLAGAISVTTAPTLARHVPQARLIAVGLLVVVVSQVAIVIVVDQPVVLIVAFAVQALGGGPLLALGVNLVLGAAPPEKAGAAAALPQLANEFGAALGTATLGSVGAAVYVASLQRAGLAPDVAARAQAGIASAYAAAEGMPGPAKSELIQYANTAFLDGVRLMAVIAAGIAAVLAIMIGCGLRHLAPLTAQVAPPDPAEPITDP